ncbi:Hypothetical_protein [Hexamita inflata]|uniref:Hypothetical_protein n=1 Tax=Hexamita inflata TaxID=28002 RepID=A0AA86PE10_9EUKA|nr:Hypothetical protein HINF_LOCUS24538 [Hexamita inflata]
MRSLPLEILKQNILTIQFSFITFRSFLIIFNFHISHSLNFRLYWISIVFQTFEGIKGLLLHLEEAPSEERVNARFSCAFIGFRALASLGLFLLGRQVLFSLFQDIFNVLDFLQRFNILLEYSAMIFRYEISLVERLHNNHQVRLYLRDLHVRVVFCVVLYNIFKLLAVQFFLVQFRLKLFFRDHLSNFASLLFNLTQCLHVSFYFNVYSVRSVSI